MFLHLSVIHSQGVVCLGCLPLVLGRCLPLGPQGCLPLGTLMGTSISPGHTHPLDTHTFWTSHPLDRPPGHPLYRWPLKRMVRILLECILVSATLCVKTWIRSEFTFFYFLFIYFFVNILVGRTNRTNLRPYLDQKGTKFNIRKWDNKSS